MTSCRSKTNGRLPDISFANPQAVAKSTDELSGFAHEVRPGISRLELVVPDMHCAGCIGRIERALNGHSAVTEARVNMSTRRVAVQWRSAAAEPAEFVDLLQTAGYASHPFAEREDAAEADRKRSRELVLAMAVAGFAAGNIMLLSVSVWSGASDATRDLFHWLSALIALPAIAFSGRVFFRSAWTALSARSLNMDVPISLAVILAGAMSLYETIGHGDVAYFDAAVMLLFFLLVGRYLDHRTRARARDAVSQLVSLTARTAAFKLPDGSLTPRAIAELAAGDIISVAPDESLPVDGVVVSGTSDIDRSMLTGESMPETASAGTRVHEGTTNLSATLDIRVEACGGETLLASIIATMEAAEQHKAHYVRLADAAARIYAPAVHITALATFIGWMLVGGGDWHTALLAAIAVLIITCPCALGLAVPVVQVVASGALFQAGIMAKSGDAMERLAAIDTAVFDKTGTLTLGRPHLTGPAALDVEHLGLAAGLAAGSRHPLSRAVTAMAAQRGVSPTPLDAVEEVPGSGLLGHRGNQTVRLGSRAWCGEAPGDGNSLENETPSDDGRLELCLKVGDSRMVVLRFEDEPRPDAVQTLAALKQRSLKVEILSGDRPGAVEHMARLLGIKRRQSAVDPVAKARYLQKLAGGGAKVLMVGDGINDAPALAAGYTSMAPSTAADVGRMAADFVFFGDNLSAVATAHTIARRAKALVLQNFGIAAAYNVIAIPFAVLGYASPLVAAIAMSTSSIIVSCNAMRLRIGIPHSGRDTASGAEPRQPAASARPSDRSAA